MPSDRPSARPAARLYLITPIVADPAAMGDQLDAALAATDTAAVLLRLAAADERTLINRIKVLASTVQAHDAALLVEGHPDFVARAGADGAHLFGSDALVSAIRSLKPQRIAGVGRLPTRHDAMIAAEAGADYVLFGDPDARGARPSLAAIAERVAWWSELFEIPCVAYAERFGDMGELCAAGADFIAIGEPAFADPQGCAAALAQARAQAAA
ncbi:MAG: thiamine phosphate synthase [Xanthobacteraceae bacterium]|nr:thiamine phosphate synthase [Xanthobacteraceae bacterium]